MCCEAVRPACRQLCLLPNECSGGSYSPENFGDWGGSPVHREGGDFGRAESRIRVEHLLNSW